MKATTRWLPAIALVFLSVSGCDPRPEAVPATEQRTDAANASTDCAATPTMACIVGLAQAELATLEDGRQWTSAASELGIALVSAGRSDEALSLLQRSVERAAGLATAADRLSAMEEILRATLELSGTPADALRRAGLASADATALEIPDDNKRIDLQGKLAVIRAHIGDHDAALEAARAMPETDSTHAAYKGRTLHDIAPILAASGNLAGAVETIATITMGIPYYGSVVRSDVASIAAAEGEDELARTLLEEAEEIASAQEDGYFVAGALRQVADTLVEFGEESAALDRFAAAAAGARTARTPQEQARALSRVATSLADGKFYADAVRLLPEAIRIAAIEENQSLQAWAGYEIAGSAAFAGDFPTARERIDAIPSALAFSGVSLTSAARRDLVFGLARHGRLQEAVEAAGQIETTRERIQALCRIVRVMADPDMAALPRYL